jgi:hypothetical protein
MSPAATSLPPARAGVVTAVASSSDAPAKATRNNLFIVRPPMLELPQIIRVAPISNRDISDAPKNKPATFPLG